MEILPVPNSPRLGPWLLENQKHGLFGESQLRCTMAVHSRLESESESARDDFFCMTMPGGALGNIARVNSLLGAWQRECCDRLHAHLFEKQLFFSPKGEAGRIRGNGGVVVHSANCQPPRTTGHSDF